MKTKMEEEEAEEEDGTPSAGSGSPTRWRVFSLGGPHDYGDEVKLPATATKLPGDKAALFLVDDGLLELMQHGRQAVVHAVVRHEAEHLEFVALGVRHELAVVRLGVAVVVVDGLALVGGAERVGYALVLEVLAVLLVVEVADVAASHELLAQRHGLRPRQRRLTSWRFQVPRVLPQPPGLHA